jgi:two-component system, chemotaxis family, protein-glutamate methylesterase/glutaminase
VANGSVVALGGSAGGVAALVRIASGLPADLGAPVLVVLHVPPTEESRLPEILTRAGPLPAQHARDGDELEANRIYVAPPDHHLLVADGRARVIRGAAENGHRPAIDPLLRTAALAYGERVVAVIVSGALDDGAAGAHAVSQLGGSVLVQDPREAPFPDMPSNAIRVNDPAAVLPLAEIPAVVARLVKEPGGRRGEDEIEEDLRLEVAYAAMDADAIERAESIGDRSAFSCPACGGVLWEMPAGEQLRLRCRIGHAVGAATLELEQDQTIQGALEAALRALQERADLARRVGRRLRRAGAEDRADGYDRVVEESERDALVIRRLLLDHGRSDG